MTLPGDLTPRLFRALYPGHDLTTVHGTYVVTPKEHWSDQRLPGLDRPRAHQPATTPRQPGHQPLHHAPPPPAMTGTPASTPAITSDRIDNQDRKVASWA